MLMLMLMLMTEGDTRKARGERLPQLLPNAVGLFGRVRLLAKYTSMQQ